MSTINPTILIEGLKDYSIKTFLWETLQAIQSATGTVTLDTGGAGSVDSITVNGVDVMSGAEAFNTDLDTTATNVASNITAHTSSPDYNAAAVGSVITITAVTGGTGPNDFAVVSTATTITTTDTNMTGGDTVDDGNPIGFPEWADRSIQVSGTFGGATLRWEGSNDGSNYAVLTDPQGNALNFAAAKLEQIMELTKLARPRVIGGNATTNLDVMVLARRQNVMRT